MLCLVVQHTKLAMTAADSMLSLLRCSAAQKIADATFTSPELACQGTTYGSNQSKSSESADRIFQSEVPVVVEVRDPGRELS